MSSNEKPHAGVDNIKVAADAAATILLIFMSVLYLSCEGSYTRLGASPGFRLHSSSASFAGPPSPTGQRGFVSGYSCATAPDFHGIPFSQSQKRRVLYSFPRRRTSRKCHGLAFFCSSDLPDSSTRSARTLNASSSTASFSRFGSPRASFTSDSWATEAEGPCRPTLSAPH